MPSHDPLPNSVNWVTGMLVTPAHLFAQERYAEAMAVWSLRYCLGMSGLVGGGVRVPPSREVVAQFDPQFHADDDGTVIKAKIEYIRGVTMSGRVVDLSPHDAVACELSRKDLGNQKELFLSVVHTGEKEEAAGDGTDVDNPAQLKARRVRYRATLKLDPQDVDHAVVLGRLLWSEKSKKFELDRTFIPTCVSVCAHSGLFAEWERLFPDLTALVRGFTEVHDRGSRFLGVLTRHGVTSPLDLSVLGFAALASYELDMCAGGMVDLSSNPGQVLGQVQRTFRAVSTAFGLLRYDEVFKGLVPDSLWSAESRSGIGPRMDPRTNWRLPIDEVRRCLEDGNRVLGVLGEKYRDFPVNRLLARLPHFVDNERVYVRQSAVPFEEVEANKRAFTFRDLPASATNSYHIVLCGAEAGTRSGLSQGDTIRVSLPTLDVARELRCSQADQRNVALDLGPLNSVPATLRLTVDNKWFERAVLYLQKGDEAPPRVVSDRPPEEAKVQQPPPPKPKGSRIEADVG